MLLPDDQRAARQTRFEREFSIRVANREGWSGRGNGTELKAALFERSIFNPVKAAPAVRRSHPEALSVFKDAYLLELHNLHSEHAELSA